MKKYIICKYDKYGDSENVWTIANSEEEAIDNIQNEYWDGVRYELIRVENV